MQLTRRVVVSSAAWGLVVVALVPLYAASAEPPYWLAATVFVAVMLDFPPRAGHGAYAASGDATCSC
jgi:hypothetical protein